MCTTNWEKAIISTQENKVKEVLVDIEIIQLNNDENDNNNV